MIPAAHDDRDHRFAKYFGLPIKKVVATDIDVQERVF